VIAETNQAASTREYATKIGIDGGRGASGEEHAVCDWRARPVGSTTRRYWHCSSSSWLRKHVLTERAWVGLFSEFECKYEWIGSQRSIQNWSFATNSAFWWIFCSELAAFDVMNPLFSTGLSRKLFFVHSCNSSFLRDTVLLFQHLTCFAYRRKSMHPRTCNSNHLVKPEKIFLPKSVPFTFWGSP